MNVFFRKYLSRSFLIPKTVFLFLLVVCGLLFSSQPVQSLTSTENIGVSITIKGFAPILPPTQPLAPGSWTPPIVYSTAIFKGKAYPGSLVTILKDGTIGTTFKVDASGYFSKSLSGLRPKIYTFGIWAEDIKGRKSLTLNYSISLTGGTITTMEVFLPPTFEIDSTEIKQGEDLGMTGQAFPFSNLNIFVFPNGLTRKTSADEKGDWSYKLDTAPLALGFHTSKVQSQTHDGEQSPFSETLEFCLEEILCPRADLNRDGKTDMIDFSILLYWWQKYDACADQNQDGIINLIDFSIMMYYWTG